MTDVINFIISEKNNTKNSDATQMDVPTKNEIYNKKKRRIKYQFKITLYILGTIQIENCWNL